VPLDLVSENGCVSLLLIVWLQISLSACSGCCLIFTGTTQPDLVLCFWTASILASRDFSTSSGAWSVFLVFFAGFFLAQVDYRCGFCAVQSLPGLWRPPVFGFSAARTKFPIPDPAESARAHSWVDLGLARKWFCRPVLLLSVLVHTTALDSRALQCRFWFLIFVRIVAGRARFYF
jgi:hypothetical protein